MMKLIVSVLLLIPLILSACQPPSPTVVVPILPTAEPTGTATLVPTATAEPSPTPTTAPTAAETPLYTSERYGVQFEIPEGMEQVGEDQFQGEKGFIQIEPFESTANYVSRACDWEANLHPEKYGLRPQLVLQSWAPEFVIASCTLIPSPTAADGTVQIFFRSFRMSEEPKLAVLRMDPESAEIVQSTFHIIAPEGDAPDPEPDLRLGGIEGAFTGPETQVVNAFTFSKWRGPQEKLDELREKALSRVPPLDGKEDAARHNEVLAPYGYLLVEVPVENGYYFDLYQGEQIVADKITVWSISASENDFSLVIEKIGASTFNLILIRKNGLTGETWTGEDLDNHFWMWPVFVGDKLATVEKETDSSTTRAVVKLEGEPVYTYASSMYDYERTVVRSFDSWDGHWVMNVNNTLIIDGENINTKLGYGEVFDWMIFEGKPWFFFEKDGRYGISYDGEELPITREHIPHLGCCGGWHNPTGPGRQERHDSITFFAWEDGAYSYYEVRR